MRARAHNIVQAEFFLVGDIGGGDLGKLGAEMMERVIEGAPIKLCLRFFDVGSSITQGCVKYVERKAWWESQEDRFLGKNGITRHLFMNRLNRLRSDLHVAAVATLTGSIRGQMEVAIEMSNHGYRLLRRDEAHETIEMMLSAARSWLFVFAPNQLCADENKLLAGVM